MNTYFEIYGCFSVISRPPEVLNSVFSLAEKYMANFKLCYNNNIVNIMRPIKLHVKYT